MRTTAGEQCWFLTGHLLTKELNLLVDTGASPNVLSNKVYNSFPKGEKPGLIQSTTNLMVANGKPLKVYGEAEFELCVSGKIFSVPFVVADLGELSGILGMQFLSQEACIIDTFRGKLKAGGNEFFMHRLEQSKCCRVRLQHTTTVQPDHEQVIIGSLDKRFRANMVQTGVVEVVDSFIKNTGLLVAHCVVNTNQPQIIMTCMNLTTKPVTVQKGVTVGLLKPVERITTVFDSKTPTDVKFGTDKDVSDVPDHLQEMVKRSAEGLTDTQRKIMCSVVINNQTAFVGADGKLGSTDLVEHKIDVGNARPIKTRPYRIPQAQKNIVENEVKRLLDEGVIEPSDSPWAAGVVLVQKKDGTYRMCVDYRAINRVTSKDAYPLPNINQTLDALSGSHYFSTLDLISGFHQTKMAPESKPLTCFTTHIGNFAYNRLPFGLTNAPSMFERLMEKVLHGLLWSRALVFIDDICTFGANFETAALNLHLVLQRFSEAGLKLKQRKCSLFRKEVAFLGHVVCGEGVKCDPEKIRAVKDWETPKNLTELRSFTGLVNYYRRFVSGFAQIAGPLTALTSKNVPFIWTEDCQKAFDALKQKLIEAPILAYPTNNPDDRWILDVDASDYAVGGVLSQVQNGVEKVISYGSHKLNKAQRNYCTTYKELYSCFYFCKMYRYYLIGRNFTLRTDHKALTWLMGYSELHGMIGRWLTALQGYDFEVIHRAGRLHSNADSLSRKGTATRRQICGRPGCSECKQINPIVTRGMTAKTPNVVGNLLSEGRNSESSGSNDRTSGSSCKSTQRPEKTPLKRKNVYKRRSPRSSGARLYSGTAKDTTQGPGRNSEFCELSSVSTNGSEGRASGSPKIPSRTKAFVSGEGADSEVIELGNIPSAKGRSIAPRPNSGTSLMTETVSSSEESDVELQVRKTRRKRVRKARSHKVKDREPEVTNSDRVGSGYSGILWSQSHNSNRADQDESHSYEEAVQSDSALSSSDSDREGSSEIPNWLPTYNVEELKRFQDSDPHISKVKTWKIDGRICPNKAQLWNESQTVRALCSQWQNLEVLNGLLYKRWTPKHLDSPRLQLVASPELRKVIFKELHSKRFSGAHMGVTNTLLKVRSKFYWPSCKQDITRWVKECQMCQIVRPGPKHRAKLHQVPVGAPFDRIGVDLMGPFQPTENRMAYILVASDYFSKWTMAWALPDITAQTVADKLVTQFFCVFGCVKTIHTDQGSNFESHLFQAVCKLLGIEKTRTLSYRPCSDGQVERWNRSVQKFLKCFVNSNRNDWDDHLDYLCAAYRATPHASTGVTPNLMVLGREINFPLGLMVGEPPDTKYPVCPIEYVEWIRGALENAHEFGREKLQASYKRQKNYYDRRANPHDYKNGSFVWRYYLPASKGKLATPWQGPYKIVGVPNTIHRQLQRSPGMPIIKVHVDQIKPYFGDIPAEWVGYSDPESSESSLSESEPERESDPSLGDVDTVPEVETCDQTDQDRLGRGCRVKKPKIIYSP